VIVSCTETEFDKVLTDATSISGEYDVALELTQPFAASDHQLIAIFNTANSDSLWIVDANFFESQVKVPWTGENTFSISNGEDIIHGEVVDIIGEIFPANDSIHVEWRYLQGTGDPADDFVVTASGFLYNGLTN
jgi:hypothetical protein